MAELKPCPFCGSEAMLNVGGFGERFITCSNNNCGGRLGSGIWFEDGVKAGEVWNTRHAEQGWRKYPEEGPEPETEVLVFVDGHRSPSWSNNYLLVAYFHNGDWWEERHSSSGRIVGVIAWQPLPTPYKPE